MNNAGSAIRGSRIGAGPMGEQDRGFKAERISLEFYCAKGHETKQQYAASLEPEEMPIEIDCPSCGFRLASTKRIHH